MPNFFAIFKMFYCPKVAPNFMSHLPIWGILELFTTQKNEFGAEIWKK